MRELTRRKLLMGGAALSALSACGSGGAEPGQSAPTPTGTTDASLPPQRFDYGKYFDGMSRAEGLASGDLTPELLINDAIARAEKTNPAINAIVNDLFDDARERASEAKVAGYGGQPTFIKDLTDWKGAPTYYGSRAFKGRDPATGYGQLVETWHDAGIIALGKSTTPEMGLTACTEPVVSGNTRNPWNTDHTPGGSSGGAAALVAARIVPFAHASDGGGSIRIPAACCGLFGHKPSRGALVESDSSGRGVDISVKHAVTLTVRDSIELFSIAQNDRGNLMRDIAAAPINRRLKIGFMPEPRTNAPLDEATRNGIEGVAQLCRDLGHEVFDWTMPMNGDEFLDKFLLLWSAGAARFAGDAAKFSGVAPTPDNLPDLVEPWTIGLAGNFMARQQEMPATIEYLNNFSAEYNSWLDGFDVILSPVVSTVAPKIGYLDPKLDFETLITRVTNFAAFTAPMNVAGAASMSVPLAWSDSGMPVGAMFSAKQGDDALLFQLALELEQARPWIDRIPPVSAES